MKIVMIQIDLVLGSRILLSVLGQSGYEVKSLQIIIKYIDALSSEDLEIIYEYVSDADVVGLSFNSFYAVQGEILCRYIKSKSSKHTIICGGYHATAMPEAVLEYADIVILYEAEKALPAVLESLGDMAEVEKIPGVLTKNKKGKQYHCSPEIVWDLDSLPFQSLDTEKIQYFSKEKGIYTPDVTNLFVDNEKRYMILGSRGCPFFCTYCSNHLYHSFDKRILKVRKRSVKNIVDEMKWATKMGFESFYIADDNFFSFHIEEIEEFCKLYEDTKKPFSVSGVNPNNFRDKKSEKKLQLLLGCGLSDVRVGIQSGSDKTLKRFNRGYKAAELADLLRPIDAHRDTIFPAPRDKLHVALDFICDSPWENTEDKQATVRLANTVLKQFTIFFYTLIYLPGTKLYLDALESGQITDHVKEIFHRGIAGVEDNPTNRLLFLVGILKERGLSIDDEVLEHLFDLSFADEKLFVSIVDNMISIVNGVESHHHVDLKHGAIHPYLTGFNAWTKQTGEIGKKVLFRSYHQPYG
ncbi:MAG: B12-binding domain-containing radical SAM protein [Desulfovibrionaceae bacterium]|nr:B12-binding domain-containing radical SAM protein [Desulfovibrionaceae bacterium]MBF0512684.1 B12-binding domain-containing radical SAM protein [Desulfovibrionaceae bacterium]